MKKIGKVIIGSEQRKMTKRRAKFRRHSGKMIKLFKDLFDVPEAKRKRKTKPTSFTLASVKMRPLKCKLLASVCLAMATIAIMQSNTEVLEGRRVISFSSPATVAAFSSARQERARKLSEPLELQPDPMEPCYLANNRASETLTISESTPVGTIVGELMVKGDSSRDGNIELSIKMPASSTESVQTSLGASQRKDQLNGYASAPEALHRLASATSESSSQAKQQEHLSGQVGSGATRAKSSRHLGNLIDLMPPLSIEPDTKRLILAKKLDRENLERYIQAGSFQSSFASINSLSQASSGSLTVHIKCQLKEKEPPLAGEPLKQAGNSTNSTLSEDISATKSAQVKRASRSSSVNSILIPIHLIVTDENDNWPSFIGAPYIIDLNETAAVGSLLPGNEIVALDNDQQGPLSTIEYSIVPGSFHSDSFAFLNPLDARSLIVKDNRFLDFEAQAKLQLKVMARDQGEPPNWAITSLFVNLLDQDDLGPIFERDQYRAEVKENRPGELLELLPKRLLAHDGDKQLAAPVSYAFHLRTSHSVHFELDPDLGELRVKKALPDEASEQSFCLLVRATQVDKEQRYSLTAIQLRMATKSASGRKFEDNLERFLNDKQNHSSSRSAPFRDQDDGSRVQFGQASYALEMSESAPVGSSVFTARAGRSAAISYQLLDNELGYLKVEPQSGRVTLNRSLDFEFYRQVSVRILATLELHEHSSVYPKLACDITRLQVNVLNANDFRPEFSHEQYNFQLSISDLIANFEPQTARAFGRELPEASPSESSAAEEALTKFGRRFGELEALDESVAAPELPDYRALQLGQVYCADRDFGDKLKLSLAGNKAHLFRLTQDGRLYLPLVNVTSSELAARSGSDQSRGASQTTDAAGNKVAWRSQHQINNKFTLMSGPFSTSRRNEPLATDSLDRNYLNYLLSELGQLGRLRLKVHATDEGQPIAKQSSALVVVSIISIDNFIIQRDQSHSMGGLNLPPSSEGSLQLTNSTSYQTGAGGVMMIPSMDGRSFVHINPDIIGNLLAGQNSSSSASDSKARSASADSLELAASNPVGSSLRFNASNGRVSHLQQQESSNLGSGKQQPPSLLLVDEEGAKFVAMPAAIEVYQQQVQEAADQQARQKQARQPEHEAKSSLRQSIWNFWSDKMNTRSQSGAIHWLNLSTALMLHLVVVGAIVVLLTCLRSSLVSSRSPDTSDGRNSNRGSSPGSDLWPRRLSRLSAYFGDKSSPADQAASMLARHQAEVTRSSYGQPKGLQLSGEQGQYAAFLGHSEQRPLSPSFLRAACSAPPEIVSSGAVVSALSNKMQPKARPGEALRQPQQQQQQNLFDHLKLTLNKMLDSSGEPAARRTASQEAAIMNHVSMRPLDSDVIAFEDMRDRELEVCAQLRESSEMQVHQQQQQQQQQRKKGAGDDKAPVSTFVGSASLSAISFSAQRSASMSPNGQQRQAADAKRSTSSKSAHTGAVVSINIKGPAPEVPHEKPATISKAAASVKSQNKQISSAHSSSNSSVMSLVSMSSSLSNKISEAVGRAGSDQANGSDASSINSSILLNGASGSSSCSSSSGRRGQARTPAAPPLPAPPSQQRAQLVSKQTLTGNDSRPLEASQRAPSLRQQPPENPVHVRLRRQALSELATQSRNTHQQRPIQKTAQQVASATGPASSVGGRREARTRATPPTPPPMPTNHTTAQYLYGQGKSSGKTTASPTTSIDRGYESFQSCTSACTQQQQQQQQRGRQFHSLPEYDPNGNADELHCGLGYSLPSRDQSTQAARAPVEGRPSKRRADSPLAVASSMKPTEGDTEDDDFYYCCTEAVHSSELHQLPAAGNLLSDYANHTYRQQQPQSRPQRALRASSQSRHELQAASSRSLRAQARCSAEPAEASSHTNTSNDLIPFCDQAQLHQAKCDNALQTARHHQQQQPAAKIQQTGRVRRSVASGQSSQRSATGDYYAQPPIEQRQAAVRFGAGYSSGKKQLTWFDQVEVDFQ